MPAQTDNRLNRLLRWSERYTQTDMVYMVHSGFWINLGSILVSLFSLVLYIIFARVLSPQVYGTYQYLLSAGALIGAFSLTGMNSAVVRAVAQGKEGVLRRAVKVQLLWGILPFSISLVVALYYALHGNILLAAGFVLTAVFMPINNALNTYSAYLAGKKDFKSAFLYNLSISILFYGALTAIALSAPSVTLLIATNLIVQTIGLYAAYRTVVRIHRLPDTMDEETLRYGKHLSLMGIVSSVAQYTDNILAFHFLGPIALAVYSFATAVPDRIGGLLKFIPSALLPSFSQKDPQDIRRAITLRSIVSITCVALLVSAGYALCAPFLFTLLFPRYLTAVPYSQLYAFFTIIIVASVFITALTAQKDIRALYIVNTIFPVLQLVLQVAGILLFGLWGLVGARLIANLLLSMLSGWLLFKKRGAA